MPRSGTAIVARDMCQVTRPSAMEPGRHRDAGGPEEVFSSREAGRVRTTCRTLIITCYKQPFVETLVPRLRG